MLLALCFLPWLFECLRDTYPGCTGMSAGHVPMQPTQAGCSTSKRPRCCPACCHTLQEAEVSRLSGIDASADRLRAQLAAADAALSDRDATLQLLTADKAYLSKEVQVRR